MRKRGHTSRERQRQEEFLDRVLDYFLPEDRPSGRERVAAKPKESSSLGRTAGKTEGRVNDILGGITGRFIRPSACGELPPDFQTQPLPPSENDFEQNKGDGEYNSDGWGSGERHGPKLSTKPKQRLSRKLRKPSGIMNMRSGDEAEDWDTPAYKITNVRDDVLVEGDEEGSDYSETSFVVRVRSRNTLVSDLTETVPGRGINRKPSGRSERALAGYSTSGSRGLQSRHKCDDSSFGRRAAALGSPMSRWNKRGEPLYTMDNGIDDYDEDEICKAASRLGFQDENVNKSTDQSSGIVGKESRDEQLQGRGRTAELRSADTNTSSPFPGQGGPIIVTGKTTDSSHTTEKASQLTSSSASTRRRGNRLPMMGKHTQVCEKNKGGATASLSSGLTSHDNRHPNSLIKGLMACSRGNRLERIAAQQEEMSQILIYDPTPQANQGLAFTFDCPRFSSNADVNPVYSTESPRPVDIQIREPPSSKPALLLGMNNGSMKNQWSVQPHSARPNTKQNVSTKQAKVGSTTAAHILHTKGLSAPLEIQPTAASPPSEYELPSPLPQAYHPQQRPTTIGKPPTTTGFGVNKAVWPFPPQGLLSSELDQLAPLGKTPKGTGNSRRRKMNRTPRTEWKAPPVTRSPSPPGSPLRRYVSETDDRTFPEESTYFTGAETATANSTVPKPTVYDRKRMASRLTFPTFHWQSDDASIGVMSLDY